MGEISLQRGVTIKQTNGLTENPLKCNTQRFLPLFVKAYQQRVLYCLIKASLKAGCCCSFHDRVVLKNFIYLNQGWTQPLLSWLEILAVRKNCRC